MVNDFQGNRGIIQKTRRSREYEIGISQPEHALGGAVQLGQHDAGDAGGLLELLGLNQTVLPGGRVQHQKKKKLVEMNDILSSLGIEVCSQADAGVDLEPEETGTTFGAQKTPGHSQSRPLPSAQRQSCRGTPPAR